MPVVLAGGMMSAGKCTEILKSVNVSNCVAIMVMTCKIQSPLIEIVQYLS